MNSQPSKWHSNSDHFSLGPTISQVFFAGDKAWSFPIPYCHMASEATLGPDAALPDVQPQLLRDSVKVLLSTSFNPSKPPAYCSHSRYGQATKTSFCILTLHMKMPKYRFSFREQTCRLKTKHRFSVSSLTGNVIFLHFSPNK